MDEQQRMNLTERFWNWGAWARVGSGGGGACASAERRYQAPRDDEGERLARIARMPIDVADAELMERCILRLHDPMDRKVLVWRYVDQWRDLEIARGLKTRPRLVEPRVLSIQGRVQFHLDHEPNQVRAERRMRRGLHSMSGSNMYPKDPLNEVTAP